MPPFLVIFFCGFCVECTGTGIFFCSGTTLLFVGWVGVSNTAREVDYVGPPTILVVGLGLLLHGGAGVLL